MKTTANGLYKYDCDDIIQNIHKLNCENNNWQYSYLKPGSFGYDNLVMCYNRVLESYVSNKDINIIAETVHNAWIDNYVFWRDNEPWKVSYTKPANTLGDSRRNLCAVTPYSELPEIEKNKDIVIAEIIINLIK